MEVTHLNGSGRFDSCPPHNFNLKFFKTDEMPNTLLQEQYAWRAEIMPEMPVAEMEGRASNGGGIPEPKTQFQTTWKSVCPEL